MKSKGGWTSIRCICKQLWKVIIKFDTSAQLSCLHGMEQLPPHGSMWYFIFGVFTEFWLLVQVQLQSDKCTDTLHEDLTHVWKDFIIHSVAFSVWYKLRLKNSWALNVTKNLPACVMSLIYNCISVVKIQCIKNLSVLWKVFMDFNSTYSSTVNTPWRFLTFVRLPL